MLTVKSATKEAFRCGYLSAGRNRSGLLPITEKIDIAGAIPAFDHHLFYGGSYVEHIRAYTAVTKIFDQC